MHENGAELRFTVCSNFFLPFEFFKLTNTTVLSWVFKMSISFESTQIGNAIFSHK